MKAVHSSVCYPALFEPAAFAIFITNDKSNIKGILTLVMIFPVFTAHRASASIVGRPLDWDSGRQHDLG